MSILASYPAGDTRADRRAEWTAGEYRGQGVDARVEYDPNNDAFQVVTPDTAQEANR